MGIQITNTPTGHVQLVHLPNIAHNTQLAQEGLVFMQEMIDLNAQAEKDAEADKHNQRFVSLVTKSGHTVKLLGGPAQFGYDFHDKPVIGQLTKGLI